MFSGREKYYSRDAGKGGGGGGSVLVMALAHRNVRLEDKPCVGLCYSKAV